MTTNRLSALRTQGKCGADCVSVIVLMVYAVESGIVDHQLRLLGTPFYDTMELCYGILPGSIPLVTRLGMAWVATTTSTVSVEIPRGSTTDSGILRLNFVQS